MDGAVGVAGVTRIVRHHADGCAAAMQFAQQIHNLLAILRVEVSGGLIGQQDGRITRQRAGHRNALLLTARELRRIVLDAMGHADALQRLMHFLLALGSSPFRDRSAAVRHSHTRSDHRSG